MEVTMYKMSSNFSISYFRYRLLAWIMLTVLCFSFMPSVSLAQQSTATIKDLSGNVLVSGQAATVGIALRTGDTIQTQAGASAVLELSDGNEIQLGEKTQINIDDLAQTATGARVSSIKLLAGWLRAFLSSGHQQEGSSFTIETPNAQLGVKFSQPDVEVSYNPEKMETVGIAHTIELIATNLLTGETKLVPVGSSVIIIGMMMKVIAGTTAADITAGTEAAAAETAAAETAAGMGTAAKVAIGAGALAAVGGIAAVAGGGDGGGDGDGDNGTPTYDATVTWLMTETLTAENPNGWTGHSLGETRDNLTTITQTGNTFTAIDEDGDITQGTISGNTFTFTGPADCGDRPDITGTKTGEGKFTSDQTLEGTYQVECRRITGERYVAIVTITGIKL